MVKKEQKPITNSSLIVTSAITIFGIFLGGYINSCNDNANKLRDVRINYLIEAYTKLTNASQRPQSDSLHQLDVESAVSEIQLLGDVNQISILDSIIYNKKTMGNRFELDLDKLINSLRNSLREELQLEKVDGNVNWLRLKGAPKTDFPSNQSPFSPTDKK